MKISEKINSISTKIELNQLVKSIHFKVSFWKGRKFNLEGTEGEASFRQIVKMLYHKCQTTPALASPKLIKKLQKLDRQAEEALKKKNVFIRGFTYLKRYCLSSTAKQNLKKMASLPNQEEAFPSSKKSKETDIPAFKREEMKPFSKEEDKKLIAESLAFLDHYEPPKPKKIQEESEAPTGRG